MGCKCAERDMPDKYHAHAPRRVRPATPCVWCAEKHLDHAASMARENGYADENRGYIIGELESACWHLHGAGEAAETLALALRDLRHRIQSRREDETLTDFSPYLLAIDAIIRADMAASESES